MNILTDIYHTILESIGLGALTFLGVSVVELLLRLMRTKRKRSLLRAFPWIAWKFAKLVDRLTNFVDRIIPDRIK